MTGVLASRIAGARDALPGGATAYLWALLALGVAGGAVLLVRRPGSGRAIALLTAFNALGWGLIVPPFHVPDEPAHAFYAQYLGETGKLPVVSGELDWYSGDVTQALTATGFYYVIGQRANRPSWDVQVRPDPDRVGTGNAATASSNPPLYYLAQAAVYRAAHGLGVLDRLALMRVPSARCSRVWSRCSPSSVRASTTTRGSTSPPRRCCWRSRACCGAGSRRGGPSRAARCSAPACWSRRRCLRSHPRSCWR
jgi:hypothetical protein